MYIFVFDYTEGKVYKSKLPKKHQQEPEDYLIEKGFSLDNIHFMTTSEKELFKF